MKKGDLGRAEALLVAQAHTLDSIFNELAQRAALNLGKCMNAADIYLRLALKAQTQCRATLETLAEIKNPRPTAFIKQQNVGVNQQVNNNDVALNNPRAHAQAHEESVIPTNKLLEQNPNGWQTNGLDTGTASATSSIDRELEAVGTVDRAEEPPR